MRTRTLVALGLAAVAVYVHCRSSGKTGDGAAGDGDGDGRSGAAGAADRAGVEALRADLARAREIHTGNFRLAGTTVDAKNRPIAGAKVTLNGARTVLSDGSGAFEIDHLALGDYALTAEQGDAYGEDTYSLSETSEPETLTLRVGPTAILHVVDTAGAPVVGAKITAMGFIDQRVGASGAVAFRGLDLGDTTFYISAPGFAAQNLDVDIGDDPRPRTIEATATLAASVAIGGLVVDQDGRPVGSAAVHAETSAHGWTDDTTTDEHGRWKLDGFGAGKLRLTASSDDCIAVAEPVVALDGASPRLDLVVHVARGATIDGVVTDAAGQPVSGARVHAGTDRVETDAQGRFHAPGLDAGDAEIDASTDELGAAPQQVTLAAGGHADVRIALVETAIEGTVENQAGAPVANAEIFATGLVHRTEHSDAQGHFKIGGIAPGEYELTAMRESESIVDDLPAVKARVGDRRVALVLPDAASLTGRVVMDGEPVDYFGVAVSTEPDPSFVRPESIRTADGRFEHGDLRPGTTNVILIGPSFERKVIEHVQLTAGGTTELGDIAVTAGRRIRGRVVDASGAPVANASVVVAFGASLATAIDLRQQSRGERSTRTDAAGHFALAGVSDDLDGLEIQAQEPARGLAAPRPVTPADFDGDVQLVLAATGGVAGTVRGARGDVEYRVTVTSAATSSLSFDVLTDEGDFAFAQLPAGDYIAALDRDLVTAPIAFHVAEGTTTTVEFERPEQLIAVDIEITGSPCTGVALAAPDATDVLASSDRWIALARCTSATTASIDHVAPGRYQLCNEQCATVDIAAAPARQRVTLNEPSPSQEDPSPTPDPEAPDPAAAEDEAGDSAD